MNKSFWVFHGTGSKFSNGIFENIQKADLIISKYKLSGILSEYPLNNIIYDWAIEQNFFTPEKPEHNSSAFIQKFSSASQNHFHYEDGERQ